jgi:hypothetical protein
MTQRDNILQELNELGSSLSTYSLSNPYHVPGNYFEGLAGQIMARIKASEGMTSREELANLSSFVANIPPVNPYQVPAGYFDGLEKKLLQAALQAGDNQTVSEELESLSPLLGGLKKQTPYSVPDNYFENLQLNKEEKPVTTGKVVSLNTRKWIRYAAAAVVTGLVAISALLFFKNRQTIDPADKSYAWVKKNMNKVSTDELDSFINLAEQEAPVMASNNSAVEIKELIRNIPDEAIQDFLNDAQDAEPDSNDDILLN